MPCHALWGVRGVRGIIQTCNLMHFVYLAPCTLRLSSKPLPSANQNSERGRDRARVLVSVSEAGFGQFCGNGGERKMQVKQVTAFEMHNNNNNVHCNVVLLSA